MCVGPFDTNSDNECYAHANPRTCAANADAHVAYPDAHLSCYDPVHAVADCDCYRGTIAYGAIS